MAMAQQQLAQAAKTGDQRAQTELGRGLLIGRWGSRQYKIANHWLQTAADSGSIDSEAWLGSSYVFGLGVPQNKALGIQLIETAAAKGSAVGIRLKGVISDNGFIAMSDPRQAANF